jgi:hypothetical protein
MSYLSDFFPTQNIIMEKNKPMVTQDVPPVRTLSGEFNNLVNIFKQKLSGVLPQKSPQVLSGTPLPSPTQTLSTVQPQQNTPLFDFNKAIGVYGGADAPLKKHIPQMENAVKNYEFWRNNPELLALIPHLETSSGRNITRPNNITNWGINYPGNNEIFSKMTVDQVFERFVSGLGKRSKIYKKFRTGKKLTDQELLEFALIYEPQNLDYGNNLIEGRNFIKQQLGY